MMSTIFDMANGIVINRFPTIRRAISIGGIGRTESAGPSFFYLEATLPLMYEEDYRKVDRELLSIDDGVTFLTTNLPHKHNTFLGKFSASGFHMITSISGRVITISGFDPSSTKEFTGGDYIQFNTDTKVYQVVDDADSNGLGVVSITVHTDLINPPSVGSIDAISRGDAVQYKLILTNRPSVSTIPGRNGDPMYEFNEPFEFREIT